MLPRCLIHPTSPLETQLFYFFHRSKAAVLQQLALAVFCFAASEAVLRQISKFLSRNKDTIVEMARSVAVDVQQKLLEEVVRRQQRGIQVSNIDELGPVDGDHFLPFAKMVLAHQDEPTDFFGPAVVKAFLVQVGLKDKSDATTGFRSVVGRFVKKVILKQMLFNRLLSFGVLAIADVASRPLIEKYMSINTTRAISHLASARPDGISSVYSLSSAVSLNNVVEFQAHAGNYWLGRVFRVINALFDPFTAPSHNVGNLAPDSETKQVIADTLFTHMNLTDICIYTAGIELTMQLRMLPLISGWGSAKAVVKDRLLKREVPRMIGRWAIFLGATVGLTKVTSYSTYTCSVVGFIAGMSVFPWTA